MSTEKMAILKMLEDKKITAAEAAQLLESMGKAGSSASAPTLLAPEFSSAFTNTVKSKTPAEPPRLFVEPSPLPEPKPAHKTPELHIDPPKTYAEPPRANPAPASDAPRDPRAMPATPVDPRAIPPGRGGQPQTPPRTYGESFAEEMSRKLGTFMKDMEPKLQKFTEVVVEKTVGAADALSRSISTPAVTPPPRTTAPGVTRGGIEKVFEMRITEAGGELSLAGLNGPVLVRGYNGDKISAKIYYVPKHGGAAIDLMALGSKYYLHYDDNDFARVCIDAFIPEKMFDNIRLSAINGALTVSTLTAANVKLEGLNGETELSGVSADNVIVECNNGVLRLRDISAERASIENFNGPVSATNTDIGQMKLSTFNGRVSIQTAGFRRFNEYTWDVESSNGKMGVVLPSSPELGYAIRATSALGTVKLGLVGLSFSRNDRSFAEAQSVRFNEAAKKIRLTLATSNAALEVN